MILFDTETTGLPELSVKPVETQPRIIEMAFKKIDWETLEEVDRFVTLVHPGPDFTALDPKITEITGLTFEDLKGARRFPAHYTRLCDFFLGERTLIAHNLPFDAAMLRYELTRIGREFQFPWPCEHICTAERSQDLTGKYISLTNLYTHYYGVDPGQQHRGMGDVDILHDVVRAMRKEGRL